MFDKRLMLMCPESKKYILGNILLQFLELCLNVLMIVTIALSVQRLYDCTWMLQNLPLPLLLILCTVILRFFTTRYAVRMSYLASRTVKRVMREKIYGKLLRLGTSYREHVTTAELVQEAVEGVDQLESYFGQYVPQFFYAFMAPIALFFLFGFGGSWKVAAVLLICVPLIPGAIMMVQKIAKKILAKYWGQYTQLGSTFLENLQGMTTLKTYQADGYKNVEMNKESEHFRKVTMAVLTMQLNSVTIMDFVAYGGAALGILLAAQAFISGSIGLANVIFMILLSADFFLPMRRLGSYFHVAMNGMGASDKIFKFLGEKEPKEKKETVQRGGIELKNVRFAYEKEREILHGVDLAVPDGGITGIVGPNGCGKSTLVKSVCGIAPVSSGEVWIDGRSAAAMSRREVASALGYVGQDTNCIFDFSVEDVIGMALYNQKRRRGRSREIIRAAMEELDIARFAGRSIQTLSGGERKLVFLARALAQGVDTILLDEPTNHLDIRNQLFLLDYLRRSGKTILIVLHDLRLAAHYCDRLALMKDGAVIATGDPQDVLAAQHIHAAFGIRGGILETGDVGRDFRIDFDANE